MSTPASPSRAAVIGAVIAADKILTAESAAKQQPAKRRGSNRQPGRTRFVGRNSRSLKRMISAVEVAKNRPLTVAERSACASLSMPLTREGSGGR